ncbi:MAG: glycosyltransferase [Acetobacteraceae bacterium]
MSEYDADVVILALDRPAETEAAIASAFGQRGVRHRVVVVDQGSLPDTLARLERVVAGKDATLVSLGRNLGVAAGRNRGAAIGRARVIVGLDNDAVFATPDTLAAAVAALDADPSLAAIGFRILIERTGEDDRLSWGYPRALLPRAGGIFDATTFVGAGHATRRTAWDQAGGYDEALFFCWEELDFCLRAIALGWGVRYRGDIEVRHKVSAERRLDWGDGRWFHFVRNRLYIGRKQGCSWAALAPRAGGYLIKGARNGLALETLRAIRAAARMSGGAQGAPASAEVRAYLDRHDAAYREGPLSRLRTEVFARLPGAA